VIVNITNPQAIEDWLQEMSDGKDDIAVWLQKAFTKGLKKREESAVPLRELPENPPEWMKPDGTYHMFHPDPELKEKVSHIRDWLEAAKQQDPTFIENLYPMDLTSAYNKAQKYGARQNQKNRNIIEDDADTKTIMRFDNGFRIAQLMTLDALKYEGGQMTHCVGDGAYDGGINSNVLAAYSLRDAQNEPHATIQVLVDGNALFQCRGKENKPVVEKYMPMILQFLTQQKFDLMESASTCGLIQDQDNDHYYSVNNLPENLSYSFHLYLQDCTTLTHLPKGLSVKGDLSLLGCTGLTQLPDDLCVGRDLNLNGCTNITSIPRSMKCPGTILTDLGRFTSVAEAADAFDRKYRPHQQRPKSPLKAISA